MGKRETAEEAHERGYIEGRYFSDTNRLRDVLLSLRGFAPDDDPLVRLGWETVHRRETVAQLRAICRVHGDNDWPDDAHLGDVVEKHLGVHITVRRRKA